LPGHYIKAHIQVVIEVCLKDKYELFTLQKFGAKIIFPYSVQLFNVAVAKLF
jgi:hypothetical protein